MPGQVTGAWLDTRATQAGVRLGLAATGSLAISLLRLDGQAGIAAANRRHARDPQRTLKLLQTA